MKKKKKDLEIHPANEKDVALILSMIRELAEIEGLSDEVTATEDGLRETFFEPNSISEVYLVYLKGEVVAYFIYCPKIEAYSGKNEIYLDHIYVSPAFRHKGIGRAIMAHLGRVARERGATRVEWVAVESNHDALKFYTSIGGKIRDNYKVIRLDGKALKNLAKEYE